MQFHWSNMDVVHECGFKRCLFLCKISPEYQNSFGLFFMGNCMNFWLCHMSFEIPHISLPNQFCRVWDVWVTVLAFVDDTLLQGDTEHDCQSAMMATCQIFRFLWLHCPLSKSVLQPTQRIEFLEFWLDLVNMIVSLTDRKVKKIRSVCVELLEMEVCSIRHTTDIIGYLVAAHPGVWVCSCVL